MEVGISELRVRLGDWIDAARDGSEVIVTDRGMPVARIVRLDSTPVLERLRAEGVIGRPEQAGRPMAGRAGRPVPRRPVSDTVGESRR